MKKKNQMTSKQDSRLSEILPCYVPAGCSWQNELRAACAGLVCSFLFALLRFGTVLSTRLDELDYAVHYYNTVIADFTDVFSGCLLGFYVMAIAAVPWAVIHYNYHFKGSKSIYLMRRLPKKNELWKRCITFPASCAVLAGIGAFLTTLLCFCIYLLAVPDAALQPGQWEKLWS